MSEKRRIDALLVERGLAPSRERAKLLIMEGLVYVNHQKTDKAGDTVPADAEVEVRGKGLPYVSRGGLKLEKAMAQFPIVLDGKVTMDIGASTGGFTDCMLQNGAARVYAIDVGYGQLAWKLRTDPRVVNLERTNVRYLTAEQVPEQVDFFSVDVSFISLSLVLPAAFPFLRENGEAVCLVKPQFEAGRGKVGKKGVGATLPCTVRCWKRRLAMRFPAVFPRSGSPILPSKGRRETLNIFCISDARHSRAPGSCRTSRKLGGGIPPRAERRWHGMKILIQRTSPRRGAARHTAA